VQIYLLAFFAGCDNNLSRLLNDSSAEPEAAVAVLPVNVLRPRRTENGSEIVVCYGQLVSSEDGTPLVELNLAEKIAARLSADQQIWVGHDGQARVTKIRGRSPLQGAMEGERILLESEEPLDAERWEIGDVVEIRFRASLNESGFWLPLSAVHGTADKAWSVLTAVQSDAATELWRVERVDCEVIGYEENRVLVKSADLTGAVVVADGSHRVVSGQKVTLAEAQQSGIASQAKGDQ